MPTVTISRKALKAAFRFAAEGDVRYYLNGALIEASPTETRIVCTDGHTMGIHRATVTDGENTGFASLIIPREVIKTALAWKPASKYLKDAPMVLEITGECRLSWGDNNAAVFKPIDGKFPDYSRVIPRTVTGEMAQYQASYLSRCQSAAADLGSNAMITVGYNGNSPALVDCCSPDFVAVVMPIRAGNVPEAPAWVSEPVAVEPAALKIAA